MSEPSLSSTARSLVPVRANDIVVGVPMPFSLFSRAGALIVPQGHVVPDAGAHIRLLAVEPYREGTGRAERAGGVPAEVVPSTLGVEHPDPMRVVHHNAESVQLTFRLPGDPEPRKATVQLIGKLGQTAIVVSVPPLAGRRDWHALEGLELTARMITGRNAYAFDATVMRFAALPAPHLYLTYPKAARRSPYRGATRLQAAVAGVVRLADGSQVPVVLTDLSSTGCAVDSDFLLGEVGQGLHLTFRARTDDETMQIELPAVIRNRHRLGMRGRLRHGLHFGDAEGCLDRQLRLAIKAFICDALLSD